MKLHLYFCFLYLSQKPLSKRCNALCLLHPTCFVNLLGWLSVMPRESNKRGDLHPDSSYVPVLYRHTLVWRSLIFC